MSDYFASHIGTHLWYSLVAVAALEAIAVYTWQFRRELAARQLIAIQICESIWLASLTLASRSNTIGARLFWLDVFQIDSILACLIWYRFMVTMSGLGRKVPRWPNQLFSGIVALYAVLVLTNPWHGLYWKAIYMNAGEPHIIPGILNDWETPAAYLISVGAITICLFWNWCSTGLRRRQARLALVASLVSWAGHLLIYLPWSGHIAPQPTCFLLASLITAWAFHRWSVYNLVPLAQNVAVQAMVDGLLIVDDTDSIVKMNATANSIFSGLSVMEGGRFGDLVAGWPALAELQMEAGVSTVEASRETSGGLHTYDVSMTQLQTSAGHRLGRVLIFKDVTAEKQRQSFILEQQKALTRLKERDLLGRELHDGPGQLWSFLSLQAETIRLLIRRKELDQADTSLARLLQVIRSVNVDLRESITGLKNASETELSFLDTLEEKLRWYRQHCEMKAELMLHCDWPAGILSPDVEVQLLRIVQEALTNVRKSAKAKNVHIVIREDGANLEIVVEDDGQGFDVNTARKKTGHHGLQIMRQRASEISAQLLVESEVGVGTKIRLLVPLPNLALVARKAVSGQVEEEQ